MGIEHGIFHRVLIRAVLPILYKNLGTWSRLCATARCIKSILRFPVMSLTVGPFVGR